MKKLIVFAGVLFLPSVAVAQETYSFSATAGQVAKVDIGRTTFNEQACNGGGLALTCTQAQLRAVAGHETDNVYADTQSGRELYVKDVWIAPDFTTTVNDQARWDVNKAKVNYCAFDQTSKDAACTGLGLNAGCNLYNCN